MLIFSAFSAFGATTGICFVPDSGRDYRYCRSGAPVVVGQYFFNNRRYVFQESDCNDYRLVVND